jgi:hypothetical protein
MSGRILSMNENTIAEIQEHGSEVSQEMALGAYFGTYNLVAVAQAICFHSGCTRLIVVPVDECLAEGLTKGGGNISGTKFYLITADLMHRLEKEEQAG